MRERRNASRRGKVHRVPDAVSGPVCKMVSQAVCKMVPQAVCKRGTPDAVP